MPHRIETIEADFDRVYESLSRVELQRGAGGLESLQLEDLFRPGEGLFLGFYTVEGLRHAFEKYGFIEDLAEVGFPDIRLETDTEDPDEHMMRIWSRSPTYDAPLVELVARRDVLRPQEDLAEAFGDPFIPVLTIEWLLMQNPAASFSAERPPLPGQRHPGLGVGVQVLQLLRNACRRLNLEALVTVPAYFHNAVFYSEAFAYFEPKLQGQFLALTRDVVPQALGSVGAASWAMSWNMVTRSSSQSEAYEWFHDAMVAPLSPRLEEYFASRLFQVDVNDALTDYSFDVLHEPLNQQLSAKGIAPFDLERIEEWVDDAE